LPSKRCNMQSPRERHQTEAEEEEFSRALLRVIRVATLARAGLKPEEIASVLDVSTEEVKLILESM